MESYDTPVSQNKSPYDPGWNDPPTLSYSGQQTTPNRPRNFLNKRVAFPLSGPGGTAVPTPVNLPPLPANVVIPPSSDMGLIFKPNSQDTLQFDSITVLHEVTHILLNLLESNTELDVKADGIRKRINVMEDMWINDKLNTQVKVQMRDLANALRDDNAAKADNIHKALMVDYVSEVCVWMPGIKQLIHNCAARSELLAIDKD